jgi:hypothetical protein
MIRLGTKTLNVSSMDENIEIIATHSDKWENETYKRKVNVFGIVRSWNLRCYEDNVDYNNSAFKYLQDQAKQGNVLSFIIDEDQINTSVYILGLSLSYSPSMMATNHREFSIIIQEA